MSRLLVLISCLNAEVLQLQYHINDGVEANSYIGNVPQDAHHVKPNLSSQLFSVVKGLFINFWIKLVLILINIGKDIIKVDPHSGDLRTSTKVDREAVCAKRTNQCIITAEIIITPREYFKLFKVELIIDDLNDNAPRFPQHELTIHLAENAQVGTEIRLDSATDRDTDHFGIDRYYLGDEDKLVKNPFFALIEEQIDDIIIPVLKVTKPIDFEKQEKHELRLNAIDRGGLVGSTLIHIVVDDANDNAPIFTRDKYKVQITESMPIGEAILTVSASDVDSGVNGELVYTYNSLVSQQTRLMFPLNYTTGEITVGKSIDFEAERSHVLYVQAADMGANPNKAYCTVIVEIIDTNDNPPFIEVSFIESINQLILPEDIAVGSFAAFVSISDADLGPAGEIDAYLDSNDDSDFALEIVDQESHRYIIKTIQPLDRERISEYTLTLRARDHGVPPLETVHYVTIIVSDVNDNPPYFGHAQYFLRVDENNAIGAELATIVAQDMDEGVNSLITYSLKHQSDFIHLDAESGKLTLTKTIDAEQLASPLRVTVVATDSGQPALSGETDLEIEVVDLNDNKPVFTRDGYHFTINENEPIGTVFGSVMAHDADAESTVVYSISGDYSNWMNIDSETGALSNAKIMDYESMPSLLEFDVSASDFGGMQATVFVVVELLNSNDNKPVMTFPSPNQPVIQVSDKFFKFNELESVPGGKLLSMVKGVDRDADDIKFELREKVNSVELDQHGQVTVKRSFNDDDDKLVWLPIRLRDNGSPQLTSEYDVFIYRYDGVVNETELGFMIQQETAKHEHLAFALTDGKNALLLAVLTGLICVIVLSVLGLVIRCRRHNAKSSSPSIVNRNQRGDESLDWSHELEWKKFDHTKKPLLKVKL